MAVLRGGMGTRDEPRPSSALPLPVPLPPATLCDAAFPPTPHRLLGRDGISCGIPREKPISFGTLPPAGSERVYACVYLGGEALLGTSSPAEQSTPPPGLRSAAEGWYGAAPSLPLFLPPSSPSRRAETAGAARMGGRSELRARLPAAGRRSGRSRR